MHVSSFHVQILSQLEKNEIQIYDFPESELEPHDNWMRSLLPFGIVGSNTILTDEDGAKYRCREYPWGTVNIEDQVRYSCMSSLHLSLTTEPL